jgi:hypothetical protein
MSITLERSSMPKLPLAIALTLGTALAQAADIGVSIQVSEPGVYGRIDIGRFPQPQVVVAQPVLVAQPRVVVAHAEPVYLWVPPGHRKDWRKHCGKYGACASPVYFVRDDWYRSAVMTGGPGDRAGHGKAHGKGQGKGHGKGQDQGQASKGDRG